LLTTLAAVSFLICQAVAVSNAAAGNAQRQYSWQRPATVADSIRMTRLADPNYYAGGSSRGLVAQFSPDGKQFVVLVRRGNLERNTNEFSLLLFRTSDAFRSPHAEELITLSSSSNLEAIKQPMWLDDNDTILFLAESRDEPRQLYSFKCSTKKLTKLTQSLINILAYSTNPRGDHVVILADKPRISVIPDEARRDGMVISNQAVTDLIAGAEDRAQADDCDLFVKSSVDGNFEHIELEGSLPPTHPLYLSPDGRYLVVLPRMSTLKEDWSAYKDPLLQRLLKVGTSLRWVLVDNEKHTTQPLLDAPTDPVAPYAVTWSRDSKSIIVSAIYLPLNASDAVERIAWESGSFAAEIRIPSRDILPIAMRHDLKRPTFDVKRGRVTFEYGPMSNGEPKRIVYRKIAGHWHEEKSSGSATRLGADIEIRLDEDFNSPPKIVAVNLKNHVRSTLLDLNPQFRNIALARVEHITWKATDGHEVDGGLYWPPGYVPGEKYPLIIQTHGFNQEVFSMDGRFLTTLAAQALANAGFFVVQANEGSTSPAEGNKYFGGPQWNAREMTSYEGLIDHLDRLHVIDRSRVGLVGFSSTCMDVAYALTHSKYPIAAASLTDGIDAGYFQYIAFSNVESGGVATAFEELNGSAPFGEGLKRWLQVAPGFRLDRVSAAVRLVAIRRDSLLGEWEWFSGLSRLKKPVELIYIPDGVHILEKPWDRMVSSQGNVDWFRFWLKGEEDSDPAKAEQYARWRKLRQSSAVNCRARSY